MQADLFIRPAQLKDLPSIYKICLETGANGKDATGLLSDDTLLGQFFAAPYIHYDISTCFVIDHNGFAVGYVIGVKDTNHFNEWMNSKWLPTLQSAYPKKEGALPLEDHIVRSIHSGVKNQPYNDTYPSHLHIDILPIAQGKGFGRTLIETLIKRLKEMDSSGLHLGVGAENQNAISFYHKIGFTKFQEQDGAIMMGMKFNS
jgi:ribosomal protein S18 acetylase RimI-like enzyme